MLALVLTLLFAVYLLGPELFARWLLGIFFPAPVRVRDRGEEVSRTLFGSLIFVVPVACLEYFCAGHFHDFSAFRRFYLGLASPTALTAQENLFFASAWQILVENVRFLVVPVCLWVAIISLLRCYWAKNYGRLVAEWKDWPLLTAGISLMVKPATADWHLKLSGILLPKQNNIIQADVLTTLDILYRGV